MDDFVIIGAGFAGLCTAIYFKLNNISFSIYESNQSNLKFGGSVTIFPNGMKVLREIGVADQVISYGASMHKARFSNQKGNLIGYYSMGNEKVYGEPTITIQRSLLQDILLKKSHSIGIRVNFGKKLISLKQEEQFVILELSTSLSVKAKYVIGADGIHSTVRKYVTSYNVTPAYSNQIYVGGFISEKSIVDSFKLNKNTQYITVGPQSFFAYSIVDNIKQSNYSILWYCYLKKKTQLSKQAIKNYSDKAILSEVIELHNNWHQPVCDLISKTEKIVKTNIYDILEIEKWSNNRILIIGDSSHAMNPISGQGASFAMEDAQLLTLLLKSQNEQVTNVFRRLEDIRRKRISPIAKKARRSAKFSSFKVTPILQYLRDKVFSCKLKIIPERIYNKTLYYDLSKQNIPLK